MAENEEIASAQPSSMGQWTERTELLLGTEALQRLESAHVLVVGVGGVGGYAAEMLARAGVGKLTLVDADTVALSNLNRQLPALRETLNKKKVEIMGARLRAINPTIELETHAAFLTPETVPTLLHETTFDFVVDAIDTIAPKCALIMECLQSGTKIISSMGAGAKRDITKIQYADLWDTYHCGLSKAVRNQLKRNGMRRHLPVVFSSEAADSTAVMLVEEKYKKSTCGTISYMPAVFGCYLAAYVLNKLAGEKVV